MSSVSDFNQGFHNYIVNDLYVVEEDASKSIQNLLTFSLSRNKPNSFRTKIAAIARGEDNITTRVEQCLSMLQSTQNQQERSKFESCANLLISKLSQESRGRYTNLLQSIPKIKQAISPNDPIPEPIFNEMEIEFEEQKAEASSNSEPFSFHLDHVPEQDWQTVERAWGEARESNRPVRISRKNAQVENTYLVTPEGRIYIHQRKAKTDPTINGRAKVYKHSLDQDGKRVARLVAHANGSNMDGIATERKIFDMTSGLRGIVQCKVYCTHTNTKNVLTKTNYLEDYDGNLSMFLANWKEHPPKELQIIAGDLVYGMANLHRLDISHGDMKKENVLVRRNGNGEIEAVHCDFDGSSFKSPDLKHIVGTDIYCSPEKASAMLHGKEMNWDARKKTDVWANGLMLYELLYGVSPEDLLRTGRKDYIDTLATLDFLHRRKPAKPAPFEEPKEDEVKKLIWEMLQYDPMKRPSANEVRARWSDFERRGLVVKRN